MVLLSHFSFSYMIWLKGLIELKNKLSYNFKRSCGYAFIQERFVIGLESLIYEMEFPKLIFRGPQLWFLVALEGFWFIHYLGLFWFTAAICDGCLLRIMYKYNICDNASGKFKLKRIITMLFYGNQFPAVYLTH